MYGLSARQVMCPVNGCRRTRNKDQVLCKKHWQQVPKPIRDRVWAEYQRASGSESHRAAVSDAIRSVSG
jgi:hypothetical protein